MNSVMPFVELILHGDNTHRAWLIAAGAAYDAGNPIPAPMGQGKTEAEIESLRARITELEGALRSCTQVLAARYSLRMDNGGAGQQAYEKARAALAPEEKP